MRDYRQQFAFLLDCLHFPTRSHLFRKQLAAYASCESNFLGNSLAIASWVCKKFARNAKHTFRVECEAKRNKFADSTSTGREKHVFSISPPSISTHDSQNHGCNLHLAEEKSIKWLQTRNWNFSSQVLRLSGGVWGEIWLEHLWFFDPNRMHSMRLLLSAPFISHPPPVHRPSRTAQKWQNYRKQKPRNPIDRWKSLANLQWLRLPFHRSITANNRKLFLFMQSSLAFRSAILCLGNNFQRKQFFFLFSSSASTTHMAKRWKHVDFFTRI